MNIKSDSRKIEKGDTFIALDGVNHHGHEYIEDAIKRGAKRIICTEGNYDVETIYVPNTHEYLVEYLDATYQEELQDIKLIGVTGTNGKTTTCFLIYQALNQLSIQCAYVGTIGFYINGKVKDLTNTTPDVLELYDMILQAKQAGCKYVVMEVSSHALSYQRIGKLKFHYAFFSNLTEDHLDFHKTMENYALAKQQLFRQLKKDGKAIVNIDDDYKDYYLLKENHNITFGKKESDYQICDIHMNTIGSVFTLIHKNEKTIMKTSLIGEYNIYNLMITIIILKEMGCSIEKIKEVVSNLNAPVGRMETLIYSDNRIIVDYAHTPDAMEKLIHTVREVCDGDIYAVFGCTGSREREKRPVMMKIATSLCKYVIVTIDDLHEEEANDIVHDMLEGNENQNYEVELNRKKAIEKGIHLLKHHDILLIMGKGHEDFIIVKNQKIPFNDVQIVKEMLKEKETLS